MRIYMLQICYKNADKCNLFSSEQSVLLTYSSNSLCVTTRSRQSRFSSFSKPSDICDSRFTPTGVEALLEFTSVFFFVFSLNVGAFRF